MGKLHEVIAVEKSIKTRVYSELTALDKQAQKPEPYNGFAKKFNPVSEDGETFPDENKKVVLRAEDILQQIASLNGEYFDIEATKDRTNMSATADVVVDGQKIIEKAPVTLLLFLEKQLTDIRTMIERMPVLDENKDWTYDTTSALFRTEVVRTHKTKKVPRVVVKSEAIIKDGVGLPAQTELLQEDVIVGHWNTTHLSGALPLPRRIKLVQRITKLISAVKVARQRANDTEVVTEKIAESLFGYLLA